MRVTSTRRRRARVSKSSSTTCCQVPKGSAPSTIGMASVADVTLVTIFRTILQWYQKSNEFPKDIVGLCPKVIDATLDVYTEERPCVPRA